MNVVEWTDTYGIHHWKVIWSSNSELARVGVELTTTEFRSDTPTDLATISWVQLALRANFVQLFQYHCLFISAIAFVSGYVYLNSNFLELISLL